MSDAPGKSIEAAMASIVSDLSERKAQLAKFRQILDIAKTMGGPDVTKMEVMADTMEAMIEAGEKRLAAAAVKGKK